MNVKTIHDNWHTWMGYDYIEARIEPTPPKNQDALLSSTLKMKLIMKLIFIQITKGSRVFGLMRD
jgi:hypothetical protein